MAATTSTALKAYIEGLGLGISGYRDEVPEGAVLPYVRIHEAITVSQRSSGDFGDMNAKKHVREEAQLDLFQQHRDLTTDPDNTPVVEDYDLADQLVAKLHGAHLTVAPTHVFGVRVLNASRFPEPDENVVRHLITVTLDRALT